MAKRTVYKELSLFDLYLRRLMLDKENFAVSETSFTKRVNIGDLELIFNEDGKRDETLLQLINKVRSDARSFNAVTLQKNEDKINWFDLTEKPPTATIAKIDIKSAYWKTALMLGVITPETDAYLRRKYTTVKELKLARLKALGSLATKRNASVYVNGKLSSFSRSEEPTRPIYLHVCGLLDELMKRITMEIPSAFYYYVDCVFVSEKMHREVIEYIAKAEYENSIEYTEITTLQIGNLTYLHSQCDGKQYLIPQNRAFLLNV